MTKATHCEYDRCDKFFGDTIGRTYVNHLGDCSRCGDCVKWSKRYKEGPNPTHYEFKECSKCFRDTIGRSYADHYGDCSSCDHVKWVWGYARA